MNVFSATTRFNDVSPIVRTESVRYSKYFLVYHPHLVTEVAQHLHERFHDKDERVRMESVKVVSEAAADSLTSVPQSVSWSSFGEIFLSPLEFFSMLDTFL